MIRRPPRSPLFPYTTLSRSTRPDRMRAGRGAAGVMPVSSSRRRSARPCQPTSGLRTSCTRFSPPAAIASMTWRDRKSTRLNSSHSQISYAVFCLKKKNYHIIDRTRDLIIAGGYNDYPRAIEELLFEHPALTEAVAAAPPDDYRCEPVTVFMLLRS